MPGAIQRPDNRPGTGTGHGGNPQGKFTDPLKKGTVPGKAIYPLDRKTLYFNGLSFISLSLFCGFLI